MGKGPVGRGGGTRAPAAVTATAALSFASFPQRPLRSKHGVTQARASRAPEAPTCQRDAPAAPPAIPGQGVPLQEEPSSSPRQGGRPTAAPSPAQGRRGEEAVKGGGEGGGGVIATTPEPELPDVGEPNWAARVPTRVRDSHLGGSRGAGEGTTRCGEAAGLGDGKLHLPRLPPPPPPWPS